MERLLIKHILELASKNNTNTCSCHVVTNAKETIAHFDQKHNRIHLRLAAIPEKGKANKALENFFKKEYKLHVKIIAGHKSKNKTLQITRT